MKQNHLIGGHLVGLWLVPSSSKNVLKSYQTNCTNLYKLNLHLNSDDLAGIHLDSQEDGVIADEGSSGEKLV